MNKQEKKSRPIVLVHLLFVLLVVQVALPGKNETASPVLFLCAAVLVEAACLWHIVRKKHARAAGDIGAFLFLLFNIWELWATVLGKAHPILVPTPEAVFQVFADQWPLMLRGIGSSLSLLAIGFGIALPLGALLGMLAGGAPGCVASWCPSPGCSPRCPPSSTPPISSP